MIGNYVSISAWASHNIHWIIFLITVLPFLFTVFRLIRSFSRIGKEFDKELDLGVQLGLFKVQPERLPFFAWLGGAWLFIIPLEPLGGMDLIQFMTEFKIPLPYLVIFYLFGAAVIFILLNNDTITVHGRGVALGPYMAEWRDFKGVEKLKNGIRMSSRLSLKDRIGRRLRSEGLRNIDTDLVIRIKDQAEREKAFFLMRDSFNTYGARQQADPGPAANLSSNVMVSFVLVMMTGIIMGVALFFALTR